MDSQIFGVVDRCHGRVETRRYRTPWQISTG
jgi:hypothetical protein